MLHAGDAPNLDAFFKSQSIGAHRPPHIPALRMLPAAAIADAVGLDAFANAVSRLPAAKRMSGSFPSGLPGSAGRSSMDSAAMRAGMGQNQGSRLRASFDSASLAAQIRCVSVFCEHCKLRCYKSHSFWLLDDPVDGHLVSHIRAAWWIYRTMDELPPVPRAMQRCSATFDRIQRSLSRGSSMLDSCQDSVQLVQSRLAPGARDTAFAPLMHLQTEHSCTARPLGLLASGSGPEGKGSHADASFKLGRPAAASRANAAYLLMTGNAGGPRRGGRLPAAALEMSEDSVAIVTADAVEMRYTPVACVTSIGVGVNDAVLTSMTAVAVEVGDAAVTSVTAAALEMPEAPSTSMAEATGAVGTEGRDAEGGASCHLSHPAAASQASAAYSHMTGNAGGPRRGGRLPVAALQMSDAPVASGAVAAVEISDTAVTSITLAPIEMTPAPSTSMAEATEDIGAEGKDAAGGASCQLSRSAAASQASAAYSLTTCIGGAPRETSKLTAAAPELSDTALTSLAAAAVQMSDVPEIYVTAAVKLSEAAVTSIEAALVGMPEAPSTSIEAAAVEMTEAPSTGLAEATGFMAATSSKAEQRPSEREEVSQGSFRGPSIHGSSREAGKHFKKRRWSLLLVTLSPDPKCPASCSRHNGPCGCCAVKT